MFQRAIIIYIYMYMYFMPHREQQQTLEQAAYRYYPCLAGSECVVAVHAASPIIELLES